MPVDLHGQLRVIASPDITDAGRLIELGKTGIFLIWSENNFENAGLREADRRAIANGAAPGATVLTPVGAALQNYGQDCKVGILPNAGAVLGCQGQSAPLAAAFNLVGGAGAGVQTVHQNPMNRLVFSSRPSAPRTCMGRRGIPVPQVSRKHVNNIKKSEDIGHIGGLQISKSYPNFQER